MTVSHILKRSGYNPIATLVAALREYIRTGHLPPFPPVRTLEEGPDTKGESDAKFMVQDHIFGIKYRHIYVIYNKAQL